MVQLLNLSMFIRKVSSPARPVSQPPSDAVRRSVHPDPEFLTDGSAKAVRFSANSPPVKMLKVPRDASMIEMLHGQPVADPFRPLENLDAPETLKWAKAQNKRTLKWLKAATVARDSAIAWHREIRDYVREGLPTRYGKNVFFSRQEGLASQPVILVREESETATPHILFDPNTLSSDGTVALQEMHPSPDGKLVAYIVSKAGSDMSFMRVRDVTTGQDLSDELTGLRFPGATWDPDGQGFVYARMVAPDGTPDPKGKRRALYHHRLGENQSQDVKLYERPDIATSWVSSGRLEDQDDTLFITVGEGTSRDVGLYYRKDGEVGAFQEILAPGKASLDPFYRNGTTLYARTDLDAPRGRLVTIDMNNPAPSHWQTLVSAGDDPAKKLESAFVAGGKLFVCWKEGGIDALEVRRLDGTSVGKVPTPVDTSISVGQVRPQDKTFLISCAGYLAPAARYRYNIQTGELNLIHKSSIKRDLTDIAKVERLYATSKDGTKVPMWVIRPKDMPKDGSAATLLYGYGGFTISLEPGFSFDIAHWVEQGGVYVVANLRGGGEFGRPWHEGGRLANKQNVFDDFAACAETLIRQGYTTPKRLAIYGGSNGGLLTAATMEQRPELFGAVVSAVPVTDMLRFHTHGIGSYWKSDYGDPTRKEDFETAIQYSPLHNVRSVRDVRYPPILIMTGDHDDRVAPWHAYKFFATLREKGHQSAFLRVDSRAGHGAGKPTDKVIQQSADMYAFLVRTLGPLRPK